MANGGVQGPHGAHVAAPAAPAAPAQTAAAVKALAAQVTGGDLSGISHLQGATRTYQGRVYVQKPSWKPSMLFNKAEAKSFDLQKEVFKEQRGQKHLDKILNCVQMAKPHIPTLKRSLKYINKAIDSPTGKQLQIRDLLPAISTTDTVAGRTQKLQTVIDAFNTTLTDNKDALGEKASKMGRSLRNYLTDLQTALATYTAVETAKSADPHVATRLAQARTTGQAARAQETQATRQAAVTQFQQQDVGDWLDPAKVDWKVSAEGASGVLLVKDKTSGDLLGVIKIDNSFKAGVAKGLGSVLNYLQANSPTPLPFDFPIQDAIAADPDGTPTEAQFAADLTAKIAQQKTLETNQRSQLKCDRYVDNLADAKVAFRYTAAKGKDVNKMSLAERTALFNSDFFPRDLARVGVLGPFIGLNDHVGLLKGTSNPGNLTWGEGGRLGIVDFEGNPCVIHTPGGDAVDGFGYMPAEIFNAIDHLAESLGKVLSGEMPLQEIVRHCRRNRTDEGAVQKALAQFMQYDADLGLFGESEMFMGAISDSQQQAFVARFVSELGAALTELKTMAPVIAQAHESIPNSSLNATAQQTMQQVVAKIDAFDQSIPGGALAALANFAIPVGTPNVPLPPAPQGLPPLPDAFDSSEA